MYKIIITVIYILMQTTMLSQVQSETNPLSFMFGTWKGRGIISSPEGKKETDITEQVSSKLNGSIVVVEGLGTRTDASTGQKQVVHDAFGILTQDKTTKRWMMRAYRNDEVIDVEVTIVAAHTIRWEMPLPHNAGNMRFTTDFSEPRTWKGTGEYSRDGKEWMVVMETNLTKVGE
ncbi:MAG: hypothetical protein JNM95_07960 [Chitinophagaceae bacterium]|nr:hypothetical protein [Chitinophagaceae bacterium]